MKQPVALVDCNNFYVSCERLFCVALRNKPVIVLSNRDSCVVARSNEVKKLNIKMGTPLFQIRHLVEQHGIQLFSSNYALYADVSNRVMNALSDFSPLVEVYSIDEAWLSLTHVEQERLRDYGRMIRAAVMQRVGIPVSVGITDTKTLSKIAAEIVKKRPEYRGVLALVSLSEQELDFYLSDVPIEDVWGIGPRYARFLHDHRIISARHLKYADLDWIRKHLTVVGERTVLELRGIACLPIETKARPKKAIMSAKSFGRPLEHLEELEQAVATYAARAAEKLRKQGSVAAHISVFLHTNQFQPDQPQYANSASRTILFPTAFTPALISHALALLRGIYQQGYKYKKAGVLLTRIRPQERIQGDLVGEFSLDQYEKQARLMQAVDVINMVWGNDTLFFGAQGLTRTWQMRQKRRPPRSTTRWNELLSVI
jgi:DNA polymerase V